MAITAKETSFIKFFDPEKDIKYIIPIYQREYAWQKKHCEALFNDIQANNEGYFIGSIIWVKETTGEIIDGQQRLTSLNLLLIAIYSRLCDHEFKETKKLDKIKNTIKKIITVNECDRLDLQSQGDNKDDYQYLIDKIILNNTILEDPTNFGNRRISHNYEVFNKAIKELTLEEICSLFKKICSLTFISTMVDTRQNAYTLFQTMNYRGLDLAAIDLIKSYYIRKTEDYNGWKNFVSILGNESNQEQFLRNNYNAFRKEYNNIEGLVTNDTHYRIANIATRSNVIDIYNSLIDSGNTNSDNNSFMRFITQNAILNSWLTGEKNLKHEVKNEYRIYFDKFRYANATSSFMLLLYLLRYEKEYDIKTNEMCSIFELILRFFIRRNLTNTPSTGALPQMLMNVIADINSKPERNYNAVRDSLRNSLISQSASNERLEEALRGNIYDDNRDMTRYLLCSLCKPSNNKEQGFSDFWEKDPKQKYIWTIEHILPEGNKEASNTPPCWIEMIRDGSSDYKDYDKEQIWDLVRKYRHKIGNLTMTGYNSSLSNSSFQIKKEHTDEHGNPNGYNNGLSLNDYVCKQDEWTISNIEERTNELVNILMQDLDLNI